MLQLHKDSHLDHNLTSAQVNFLLQAFATHTGFFILSVELLEGLGTMPCGLYGPLVGDRTVREDEVTYARRGTRTWESRLIDRPVRQTRLVTVVAGPHDGLPCVLYTAYGGPPAPQEPGDPGCRDREVSEAFWAKHALAVE